MADLEELLAVVPGPVLVVDLEGRTAALNRHAERYLGFAQAELEGQLIDAVIVEGARALREAVRAQGEGAAHGAPSARPIELRIRRKDGSAGEVEASIQLVGTVRGTLAAVFLTDLSGDRRARRYLEVQYALTRVLASSSTVKEAAPRVLELVGKHLGWDVGALWQFETQSQVLRNVSVWNDPSHAAPGFVRATREMTFAPGVGLPGRVWQSGAPLWIEDVTLDANFPRAPYAEHDGLHAALGLPLALPGEVIGVLEFFSRELRQPDEEMLGHLSVLASQLAGFVERGRREELREHLESVVRSTDDAMVGSTLDGRLVSWNDAAERMFGVKRDLVIGKSIFDLATPEQAKRARDLLDRASRGEALPPYEGSELRPDGRRVDTFVRVWPLRDASGAVVGVMSAITDITQRKRAHERVQKSEEMLAQASRLAHVGSWTWDLETGLDEWSEEFFRILGLEPGSLKPSFEAFKGFVHPEDLPAFGERIAALVKRGESLDLEFRIVRPGGAVRTVQGTAEGSFDLAGKLVRARGALQDLTERRQAEAALRSVEQRLATVFRASPVPIAISTMDDGRIIEANEAVLRFHRAEREDIVGRTVEEIQVYRRPEDRAALLAALRRDGALRDYELELRTLSGEFRTVLLSVDRIEFAGRPCLLTMFHDITDRMRTQEALAQSEERYRIVAETAFDGMITMDERGMILFANPSVERIFGYARGELDGKPVTALMGSQEEERHLAAFERYLRTGERTINWQSVEMPGLMKDGRSVQLEISFGESSAAGRRLFTGIIRDVTERKRAQAELSAKLEELARSNEELEQFAYIASHDLQAPLRQVMSYLQLLRERHGARLESDAVEFIDFSLQGSKRMQELIDDLLAFSRAGSAPLPQRLTDATAAARAAVDDLRSEAERARARIEVRDLPKVRADPAQLREVFQNLVANAIKFRGKEPPRIVVGCTREGPEWRFFVRDNGIGINPMYADKVFVIFQRLHGRSRYPGTGIGLAVCKKIVERLGGRIWFDSKLGEGSTFFFTLPATSRGGEPDES